MTLFEITLSDDLDNERQRFKNYWLSQWHNINVPDKIVKVDNCKGGLIRFGGSVFDGKIREIYWWTVERYLFGQVHEAFAKWRVGSRSYRSSMRKALHDRTVKLLREHLQAITADAVLTDRELRGRGNPESVSPYDPVAESVRVMLVVETVSRSYLAIDDGTAEGRTTEDLAP